MVAHDFHNRITEKIERKMERVSQKLEELRDDTELQATIQAVTEELDQLDADLKALKASGSAGPGQIERIEARKERLLAKQERLALKSELRHEMRDRLESSLDEMQLRLEETMLQMRSSLHAASGRGDFDWRQPYAQPSPSAAARKMQDERRKILEMVQTGKITADEAAQLLDALRNQEEEGGRRPHRRPRWVRIRVTDTHDDKVRVNLTLPVGLVRAGLRAGGSIAGVEGLDTEKLESVLNRGETGHILDIQDEADGERVEIFVE
jgi:polyhydroxyalkanoate synthesis regulator phasin